MRFQLSRSLRGSDQPDTDLGTGGGARVCHTKRGRQPAGTGITIKVGSSKLGEILVGPSGRTIYLFLADSGTNSSCNSASCVQNWPPVLTKGAPQAGSGVSASLLGTTTRKDGTTEVTYAGHPLYYFIADKQAGQLSGQGIDAFGAPWYAVSPSGMQIN